MDFKTVFNAIILRYFWIKPFLTHFLNLLCGDHFNGTIMVGFFQPRVFSKNFQQKFINKNVQLFYLEK